MSGQTSSTPSVLADEGTPYDPGEHTIADVQGYVEEHPDELDAVLAAEQAGKARVTLVDWLTARQEG